MGLFPYAEWLVRRQQKKAEENGCWRDHLKTHGLANFCLACDLREERVKLVYQVEEGWYMKLRGYEGEHPLTYSQYCSVREQHASLLTKYRENVITDFLPLHQQSQLLKDEDIFDMDNLRACEQFASRVFERSRAVSDGLIDLSKAILQQSLTLLEGIHKKPPCHFAVIGLGSVAKGEATPYSDLEYAFIVEEDDDYFTFLAMDNFFRIGNLGETPLKTFDLDTDVAKFFAPFLHLETAGYRIDGITKSAGNIPTGSGREDGKRLTFTIDELIIFYKMEAEAKFDGFAGDKSDMLSSTVLIYSSEGDDSTLYQRFLSARAEYEERCAKMHPIVNEKRVKSFKKDIKEYKFLPSFVRFQPPKNTAIKVKADIFRYPTLLANNLKMCLGYTCAYPWQTFSKLLQDNILSASNHLYLSLILGFSIYLRTSAYVHSQSQTTYISLEPSKKHGVALADQPRPHLPANLFVILGTLLIPIKQSISSLIDSLSDVCSSSVATSVMTDMGEMTNDLKIKAEVCYFAGKYELAKTELSRAVDGDIETMSCKEFEGKVKKDKIKYIQLCCYILYFTRCYSSAVEYFTWLMENKKDEHSRWSIFAAHCHREMGDYCTARKLLLNVERVEYNLTACSTLHDADVQHEDTCSSYTNIGNVYRELGEYEHALMYQVKALDMRVDMHACTDHHSLSNSHLHIGNALGSMGEYSSALEHYKNALKIQKANFRDGEDQTSIAASYCNIGEALRNKGNFYEALDWLTRALETWQKIYGAQAHEHQLIVCNNIGSVYRSLGEHELALIYHKKSAKMSTEIYGVGGRHPNIGSGYSHMGTTYRKLGEYETALKWYRKSLKVYEDVYGKEAKHPDIARAYDQIANVLGDRCEYRAAIETHNKSINMSIELYGTDVNHPDVASEYNNLASEYRALIEYPAALHYFGKALEMEERIYGHDSFHPDIANTHNNLAIVHADTGSWKLAIKHYQISLDMKKEIYQNNPNHPDIADTCNNIGRAYGALEAHSLSLQFRERALMMTETYGQDNQLELKARVFNGLGTTYYQTNDYQTARRYFEKALQLRHDIYGVDGVHAELSISYSYLGSVHDALTNYNQALQYHTNALEMEKRLFGAEANHSRISINYYNMATTLRKMDNLAGAFECFKKSLEIDVAIFGCNHDSVRRTTQEIDEVAQQLDRVGK